MSRWGRCHWKRSKIFPKFSPQASPQGSPQGVSTRVSTGVSTGVPRKPRNFKYSPGFSCIFRIFSQRLGFLVKIKWFLSFSCKNDAESFRNSIKKQVLDPKRAKLNPNSDFCHVRTYFCQSRRTSPCQQSRFLLLLFQIYDLLSKSYVLLSKFRIL